LSDREEQLKPLGLGKRNKTFGTVVDGVECFAGNAIGCAKTDLQQILLMRMLIQN
jgi:hypothetical protein